MKPYNDDIKLDLETKANLVRQLVIESLIEAGSGHTAGPLGMADIFVTLYFHILNHRPSETTWALRDRLVLSNGHICPVLYATMALAGYFPISELKTLRRFGSRLQGHPHREWLPGLETSSGPLGSGLSQAIGMALGFRLDLGENTERYVYALLSDGELEEGNTWEAVLLAGKERLSNLIAVIDRNGIQIDGFTKDVMPLEPVSDKFESFNWHVIEIDGHNFDDIIDAFGQAQAVFGRPVVIIAHTIPGKGIPEFERDYTWHGKPPNLKEGKQALEKLRSLQGRIKNDYL